MIEDESFIVELESSKEVQGFNFLFEKVEFFHIKTGGNCVHLALKSHKKVILKICWRMVNNVTIIVLYYPDVWRFVFQIFSVRHTELNLIRSIGK